MTRYVHEQQHICLNVKVVSVWPTVKGAENERPPVLKGRNPVSMNTKCSAKVKHNALYFCTSTKMYQYLNMMTDVRCFITRCQVDATIDQTTSTQC